jgi:hypothetical protein
MVDDVKAAELAARVAEQMIKPTKWEAFKRRMIQLVGGLVMEKNKDGEWVISIGRVAWWLAFTPAVYIWISSGGSLEAGEALKDISPNHFNILVVLAGYNFGKKVTEAAGNIFGKKSEDGPG